MSHHKLTDEEKVHVKRKEDLDLLNRIFDILDDIEDRLKILETKKK